MSGENEQVLYTPIDLLIASDGNTKKNDFSLETMCNYLTNSLQSVQGTESAATIPDFRSEITLYGNAMEQLKSKCVVLRIF